MLQLKESKVELREYFTQYLQQKFKQDITKTLIWNEEPAWQDYLFCYSTNTNMNKPYEVKSISYGGLIDVTTFGGVKQNSLLSIAQQIIAILGNIKSRLEQYTAAFIKESLSEDSVEQVSLNTLVANIATYLCQSIRSLLSKVKMILEMQ